MTWTNSATTNCRWIVAQPVADSSGGVDYKLKVGGQFGYFCIPSTVTNDAVKIGSTATFGEGNP